ATLIDERGHEIPVPVDGHGVGNVSPRPSGPFQIRLEKDGYDPVVVSGTSSGFVYVRLGPPKKAKAQLDAAVRLIPPTWWQLYQGLFDEKELLPTEEGAIVGIILHARSAPDDCPSAAGLLARAKVAALRARRSVI